MNTINFKCTGCGQCCRMIGQAIDSAKRNPMPNDFVQQLILSFPHKVNSDGSCSKPTKEGKCSIYDKRPTICNIEKMYDIHYKNHYSPSEFRNIEADACNSMIKDAGLSDSYLVKTH